MIGVTLVVELIGLRESDEEVLLWEDSSSESVRTWLPLYAFLCHCEIGCCHQANGALASETAHGSGRPLQPPHPDTAALTGQHGVARAISHHR
jgi:hypothetical protein